MQMNMGKPKNLSEKKLETWMKERCQEVEELYKKHDLFNLHKKVKEITGSRKYSVLNQDKKQIADNIELREVWTKYVADTFESNHLSAVKIRRSRHREYSTLRFKKHQVR